MNVSVSLSIGYPTATHEDIIEIDDIEYAECETEDEKENLIQEYWNEWSQNYIDGGWTIEE